MKQITELTNDAKQAYTIIGENGEQIPFNLYYYETQQSWYFDISYGNTIINGLKLTNFPNILRQWKHILPFGLGCTVTDGFDPYYIDDFVTSRVKVYLLNSSDVITIEQQVFLNV